MDMTHPSSGHEQPENPIKIQHPEEHHESGASKMFNRVKAKVKKIKNNLAKHGNEPNQDVHEEEDDDDIDEQLQQVHNHPKASESSAVSGGVTDQPQSHPRETNVPAPEETKVSPVVSSDYTKPIEPEPSRDATYGHESAPSYPVRSSDTTDKEETVSHPEAAPSYPVRSTDTSDREETVTHPVAMSDVFAKEESREAHHVPVNTSLLSETEELKRKFGPDEDEYLGGQREVNVETPKRLEQESGVAEIDESFNSMKVEDGSAADQESERDLPRRSNDFDMETESGIGKDSPARYKSEAELGKDVPIKSFELDQKTESGIDKNSSGAFGSESGAAVEEGSPTKSHGFEQKIESGTGEDLPTGFGGESGAGKRDEILAKSLEFNQETEIGQDPLAELRENLPVKSHEVGAEKVFPARSDDVEVETELGRELPRGTHDQYSSELSRPKERDDFDSSVEVTRDETQEKEHTTYAEQTGSATKNAVASGLCHPKETTGADGQYESPVAVKTLETEHKVGENVDEKFTPVDVENVKEAESTETTKLPLSGGGSGLTEDKSVRPEEEDKALWGKSKEEREQGEAVAEVEQGGGMVGKIKGAYSYWLGGTTEEVKPKSPTSVKESSQSLGSTVGTTKGLGETDGGSNGAVPVQKGL